MEKQRIVSSALAKLASAGVALALCPVGSLVAAGADVVVLASRDRCVTRKQATGVMLVMNTGMAVFASLTGLVSCGIVPALVSGVLTALSVGALGVQGSEKPAKAGAGPRVEYEGEVVDAYFVDADPQDCVSCVECAETRSGAIVMVDPAEIRDIVGKSRSGRL